MPLQVDKETELAIVRRAYAKQIISYFGPSDARVEAAFAEVPREHYLGPGPWQAMRAAFNYAPTPSERPFEGRVRRARRGLIAVQGFKSSIFSDLTRCR